MMCTTSTEGFELCNRFKGCLALIQAENQDNNLFTLKIAIPPTTRLIPLRDFDDAWPPLTIITPTFGRPVMVIGRSERWQSYIY